MKARWMLAGLAAAGLWTCGDDGRLVDGDGRPAGLEIAIPLGKVAVDEVAEVIYKVAAADMDTLRGTAQIDADDVVRATITDVPPGPGRVVILEALDGAGEVVYSGSATADVVAGQTAEVNVVLRAMDTPGAFAGETRIFSLPNGATMEFVWIEPGTFTMGSPSSESGRYDNEGPQHEVTISRGFWVGKTEITQGQWQAVVGTTPWSGQDYVQANPEHPAVYISWNDVQGMIEQLNAHEGAQVYRLPTEAEWEYACRAGTTTRWSFGDDEAQLGEYAWYYDNAWNAGLEYAQPVGTKLPNPWGLFDMHGNVWEWVQDWYGSYSSGAQVDPQGLSAGSARVVRGGGFGNYARTARSARRDYSSPGDRNARFGARLSRTE